MASGSLAATAVDAPVNFTLAHLRLDLLNASSPPTRWDSSLPGDGVGVDEPQRLIREQAYRDFTTTVQVFILICSLLGESFMKHTVQSLTAPHPKKKKKRYTIPFTS